MAIDDAHAHAGTTNLTETWQQLTSQHGQPEAKPDNKKEKSRNDICNVSRYQKATVCFL